MESDKRLTVRVPKEVWSQACINAKVRGHKNLQEYVRCCIIQLNRESLEYEKSKKVVEVMERG